jgi:hypothetical protein
VKKGFLAVLLAAALLLAALPAVSADGAQTRLDIMTQAVYDELGVLSEGLIWALRDGKFTYLDENGKTAISPETLQAACAGEMVSDVRDFREGLAIIYGQTRVFYIDRQGRQVFSAEWGHNFSGGVAIGHANGGLVLLDPTGKASAVSLPPEAAQAGHWDCGILFSDGLLPFWITKNGTELNGYVDTDFNVAIPFQFEDARPFHNGLAPVKQGGKWGFINKQGSMVIQPQYDDFMADSADYRHQVFRDGLAAVRKDGKWGYIDQTGYTAVPFVWDYADLFSEGYAVVGSGGLYGYIDATGQLAVPAQYDDANGFAGGIALVGDGGVYRFITPGGEPVSSVTWRFEGTLTAPDTPRTALYARDGKWGLLKIGGGPLDSADDWAHSHITEALAKGFIPEELQGSYAQPVTRGEFVTLAVRWLEYKTGKTAGELVKERGGEESTFSDTDDPIILAGASLDITAGVGGGRFGVEQPFSREQAAVMLCKVMEVLGQSTANAEPFAFTDMSAAADWAHNAIDYVGGAGIMDGVSATAKVFDPKGTFSRQQSIIVFNKMD